MQVQGTQTHTRVQMKNARREKTTETTIGKNAEREKGQTRLKRRIRTNSGAISMSEVEASSMAEL